MLLQSISQNDVVVVDLTLSNLLLYLRINFQWCHPRQKSNDLLFSFAYNIDKPIPNYPNKIVQPKKKMMNWKKL